MERMGLWKLRRAVAMVGLAGALGAGGCGGGGAATPGQVGAGGAAAVDPSVDGQLTIVYAWGSLEDGNLAVAVQTIAGLGSAPAGAAAGSAGLADTSGGGFPLAAALLMVLAASAAGLFSARLVRARS